MMSKIIKLLVLVAGLSPVAAQTDPSNIVCTAVNSTTLQLTWDQATAASVQGYFLHIERVDGLRIEPAIPGVDLNTKTYDNYAFYGLGKYGTYNITIHSYTSSTNMTNYVTTCTTTEDVPNGSPLTFYCTGLSTSSISCTWSSLDQVYWNGVPVGYRLQYLTSNVSSLYETTVDSNTTTTLLTGLYYGTSYMLLLNPYTSTGQGVLYSTTTAATLGSPEPVVENVTRYYCNEAVPGFLEFGWEEMPCTIYSGTIGALFVMCGLFIGILSCMSCCGKSATSDVSVNFFDSSNGKSRRHDNDDDDDDDTDTDDDNNRNMSDDEQNDDDDGDGYENKGYRSDEDPRSPDGRNTESPEEDINSPGGTPSIPPSRQPGLTKGNEKKKIELERQLTARDVELEEISDEGDDISDSDYDTQSDADGDEVWDSNKASGKGAAILAVSTVKHVKANEKKTSKGNKDGGASSKGVNTNRVANKKDINKSKAKSATTVALIHTNGNATDKVNAPEDSCNETEYRQNHNGSNDVEMDPLDSHSLQNRQMTVNQSSASTSHNRNVDIAFEVDEWGDDIVEEPSLNDNGRNVVSNFKYTGSKNLPKNKTKRNNGTNEFELHSLKSSSFENKMSVNPPSTETYGGKFKTENRSHELISPINDWDEGDGWGGSFIYQGKSLGTISDKATCNDGKQHQTEMLVFQTPNDTTGIYGDWGDDFKSEGSNTFRGTQKVVAQGNESKHDKVRASAAGKQKTAATNKANTNEQKIAIKTADNGNPKVIKNDKRGNLLQHQTDMPVFQTSNDTTGKYDDWDDDFKSEESNTFGGTQNVAAQGNELKHDNVLVATAGKQNTTATNKANANEEKIAIKNADNENPKLIKNGKSGNLVQVNSKSSENTIQTEHLINQNHDKDYQNKRQTALVSTKPNRNNKISFRDQQTEPGKLESSNLKSNALEHKNKFFIEDEIDHVNLSNEDVQRPNSEQNGKMIATKAWLPQSNNNSIKPGRKTPVKALPKVQSWTSVEIEPILGSDRLGKKFPFLSIDNKHASSEPKPASGNRLRKNVSDGDLVRQSSFDGNIRDVAEGKRISEGDVLSKFMNTKPASTDKVFYGFGTGRFRNVAAAWIGKFRSKKSPVKTVQSDWQ